MESVNYVVLSGVLESDATEITSNTAPMASLFHVVTYRSHGKGPEKKLLRDSHEVILNNPGTIQKHLLKGKSVMVQGKLSNGSVLASSVHFPERSK